MMNQSLCCFPLASGREKLLNEEISDFLHALLIDVQACSLREVEYYWRQLLVFHYLCPENGKKVSDCFGHADIALSLFAVFLFSKLQL